MAECSYVWGCKCQDSRNNTYNCLRSLTPREDSLFCQFSDDTNSEEFYDLRTDPYQLHNLAAAAMPMPTVEGPPPGAAGQAHLSHAEHRGKLSQIVRCKGHQDCNRDLLHEQNDVS